MNESAKVDDLFQEAHQADPFSPEPGCRNYVKEENGCLSGPAFPLSSCLWYSLRRSSTARFMRADTWVTIEDYPYMRKYLIYIPEKSTAHVYSDSLEIRVFPSQLFQSSRTAEPPFCLFLQRRAEILPVERSVKIVI